MKVRIRIRPFLSPEAHNGFLRQGADLTRWDGTQEFREVYWCVKSDPMCMLADMFSYIECHDLCVKTIQFPAVTKPVVEKLDIYDEEGIWNTQCTFTRNDNDVVVVGEDIEIRVPWE